MDTSTNSVLDYRPEPTTGTDTKWIFAEVTIIHGKPCACLECRYAKALRLIESLKCALRRIKGIVVLAGI